MRLQNTTLMLLSSEYELDPQDDSNAASKFLCDIEQDSIHKDGKRGLTLIATVERVSRDKPQLYRAKFVWHMKMTFSQSPNEGDIERYTKIAKFMVLQRSALLVYQLTNETYQYSDIFPPYETTDEDRTV